MHKLLRAGILITFGMLIIGIIGGCGDDSPEEVTDPSDPTTSGTTPPRTDVGPPPPILPYVVVDPAPGSAPIPPNTQFSLTFDQEVVAVTVNETPATGSGLNWSVSLMLQEGDGQTLNVSGQTETVVPALRRLVLILLGSRIRRHQESRVAR